MSNMRKLIIDDEAEESIDEKEIKEDKPKKQKKKRSIMNTACFMPE